MIKYNIRIHFANRIKNASSLAIYYCHIINYAWRKPGETFRNRNMLWYSTMQSFQPCSSKMSKLLAVVDVLNEELHRFSPPAILGHVGQRWFSKHAVLASKTAAVCLVCWKWWRKHTPQIHIPHSKWSHTVHQIVFSSTAKKAHDRLWYAVITLMDLKCPGSINIHASFTAPLNPKTNFYGW